MKLLLLGVFVIAALHGFAAEDSSEDTDPESEEQDPPNIVFILADDLGNNDIGYNNPEVISPNLDKLASDGRIFTQNYVQMLCAPSRHAIMTSIFPYKSEMQHLRGREGTPWCSPTDLPFLSERLQGLGYETAVVGKWHLGSCQEQCLPLTRGFDHQYGLLLGQGDQYEHYNTRVQSYDFRDQQVTDWGANGSYTTDLFARRAIDLIEDVDDPLFLFLTFTAPHTPLQVDQRFLDMYPDVASPRKAYLGMVTALDEAIGNVVQALKDNDKWDNTLLIFLSDNGGAFGDWADNRPYRGCKFSLWEGGSKTVGFVTGPLVQNPGQEHDGIIHAVDWTPTLVHVAGGNVSAGPVVEQLDGVDQYEMVINGGDSARQEFVYNIDMDPYELFGQAAIRVGDYKLIWGHEGFCDGWGPEDVEIFWHIPEQCALAGIACPPSGGNLFSPEQVAAQNAIMGVKEFVVTDLDSGQARLFNLAEDPYELNDLAGDPDHAEKVTELKLRLVDIINDEYVATRPFSNATMNNPETNPDDPDGRTAFDLGWCSNDDLTMP